VRLTKLLLASEGNGVRQGKLKLAERYFYREATEAARKGLAQLGAYLAAILDDASLDAQAKIERSNRCSIPARVQSRGRRRKTTPEMARERPNPKPCEKRLPP